MVTARRVSWPLLFLALAAPALAQPRLLADLAPQVSPFERFDPRQLRSLGDVALFSAFTGHGYEPWRTDGTAAGTTLFADLCPGFCNAGFGPLATVGDHLFFAAAPDSSDGAWLLRTDGTAEGTLAVAGPFESMRWLGSTGTRALLVVEEIRPANSTLLLAIELESLETEILRRPFQVFRPAPVESGGRVFVDGTAGLWTTDGTVAGTRLVASGSDLRPTPLRGGVVFWLGSGDLMFSDGGEPRLLAHGEPLRTALPGSLQAARLGDDEVFFKVRVEEGDAPRDTMWVTDGTTLGTRRLHGPLVLGDVGGNAGRVYFSARDVFGSELWTTDGTTLGTRRLADLCPGPCSSSPHSFVPFGKGVLFLGRDEEEGPVAVWYAEGLSKPRRLIVGHAFSVDGLERRVQRGDALFVVWEGRLWRIDPDLRVEELAATTSGTLATAGPWVLFEAGGGLWRTDGTVAGTAAVPVPASDEIDGSDPMAFVEHEGRACFLADGFLQGGDLWCSDGSEVERIATDLLEARLIVVGERLLAVAHGSILAVAGGEVEELLPPESFDGAVGAVGVLADELFFMASGPVALWKTDGTREGTRPVVPSLRSSSGMVTVGGRLVFAAADDASPVARLWSSDGTVAGTFELPVEAPLLVREPVVFRGAAWVATEGRLWRTDGTVEGTAAVLDLPPLDRQPGLELFAARDRMLIVGIDTPTRAIWSTDGSSPPQKLFEIERFVEWESVALGELLLFAAARLGDGGELWVTDGTPAGTQMLDVLPGPFPFDPRNLTVVGEHVLFAGRSLADGAELWITDGTLAGTRRLFAIAPGPASSFPAQMTRVGDLLFFTADDGLVGREPWVVEWEWALGGGACQPSDTRLCLGGRFAVTVQWRDHINGGEGRGHAVPLSGSDQSGTFWFFHPDNVELIVKALDGTSLNGHHWLFYGALSTVEYSIDVLDTATGDSRRYYNPPGEQCGRGDTTAFAGALAAEVPRAGGGAAAVAPAIACGDGHTLCLLGGSLTVEVDWHDPRSGDRGRGMPIPGSDNTGYFWFFDAANLELVVKALDGTTVNGHRWVFYGGLSDVEYEIRVTETATGAVRTYRNPFGEICGGADTAAF